MAANSRRGHQSQIIFLSVLLGCIVLTASSTAGASNQETTAEPSMVTFTFEGEFMFLAQMEFEVFDSNQNSVLRSGAGNHQLVLAPGQYNIEARANAGPFSIGMESLEFDSQEYSHVTLTVQYVLVTEVVSVLVLVSLALSLLKATRRSFGRLRRKRSISISSNAHVEPTDDMLAEQDPKSDTDLEDALKEHRESFSEGLDTRGDFLPPPRGGPISLYDVIDYYAPQDKPVDIDIPFWPPDDADSTGKDLWYQFKETESGTTVVELVSEADYDTRIPVYKLPYEERKRAEEESLPEQEPVDDPYYPGAPGDRELAIKYGLEWIKTPEEEKVLRELWEKENERRKKRGSILISWLVWKEMFEQEQKDLACDPEDSCEGSEQEQGSGTRAILPEDVLTPGVDDGILEHSDTGSGTRAILPNNTETPPEAPPPSNQDDSEDKWDKYYRNQNDETCYYHADGCDVEKLRERVKKFLEEHNPERLDEIEKYVRYHRGPNYNLSDEQLFQLLCENFGVDKENYDNPYKGAQAEEEARRARVRKRLDDFFEEFPSDSGRNDADEWWKLYFGERGPFGWKRPKCSEEEIFGWLVDEHSGIKDKVKRQKAKNWIMATDPTRKSPESKDPSFWDPYNPPLPPIKDKPPEQEDRGGYPGEGIVGKDPLQSYKFDPPYPPCPLCGCLMDERHHGTGAYSDPYCVHHTQAMIEREIERRRHDKSKNCKKKYCKERGSCQGIPTWKDPKGVIDAGGFDFKDIRESGDQFTIPEEWERPEDWEGTSMPGGDLNYYGIGLMCAYNCLTWLHTLAVIYAWKKIIKNPKRGSTKVTAEMITAAKAGYDEERKRNPLRCPNLVPFTILDEAGEILDDALEWSEELIDSINPFK